MIYIEDIIREVVKSVSSDFGQEINYLFGSTAYVNSVLSAYSQSPTISTLKFTLIMLHTDYSESIGNDKRYETQAEIALTMAVNTLSRFTNEERLENSFKRILIPIYESFLKHLKGNSLVEVQYNGNIPHNMRRIYDLGAAGSMDSKGKQLTELIDAIEIENLQLNVLKQKNCCYGTRI